jgi:hypothetical protein
MVQANFKKLIFHDTRCLLGTTLIVNYYNLVYNVELHEIIKNSLNCSESKII